MGKKVRNYIPDNVFHSLIEPYFNRDEYFKCMVNKNYFENDFNIKHVVTLIRNINNVWYDQGFNVLTPNKVVEKLSAYSEFVAKPCIGAGGAGVRFIARKNGLKKIR